MALSQRALDATKLILDRGMRWSAADAYLRPALKRPNVQLKTEARVSRVLFEGRKAIGVTYLTGDKEHTVRARRAVVLSAGAVQSPQLLQLSGVGPSGLLQQHGIPVVLANGAVGGNLQDHLAMSYYYKATQPTLNNVLSSWWGKLRIGLQYVTRLSGPLSISVNQVGGFVRSHADATRADLQLYCNPVTYTLAPSTRGTQILPDPFAGFILCFQPCRPLSRGRIDIASPDIRTSPDIRPGYLSHPDDVQVALRGRATDQAPESNTGPARPDQGSDSTRPACDGRRRHDCTTSVPAPAPVITRSAPA